MSDKETTMQQEVNQSQGQSAQVRINQIVYGINPRTIIEDASLMELRDSIKAGGLLQPLLIRPLGNEEYRLVAGNRRYAMCADLFGQDAFIPVLIKEMTDEEEARAALTENVIRENMTPVDEAEAAAKILGQCRGDRAEAARVLGWKPEFLQKRLGLMNAIPAVRQACNSKVISLGHAELLAALTKSAQESALNALTAANNKQMSVSELKAYIASKACNLSAAIFKLDGCVGCPNNSGEQAVMFKEVIGGSNCTNPGCYQQKTQLELESRAAGLKDEYAVVRILSVGDNNTVIKLRADGPQGVGEQQAAACRACSNFGAVVSGLPDKLGLVYRDMCLDTPCNTKMVAARVRAENDAQKAAKKKDAEQAKTDKVGEKANQATAAAPKVTSAPVAAQAAAPTGISGPMREYREKVWRAVLGRAIQDLDSATNRCVLLALLVTSPRYIDQHTLCKKFAAGNVLSVGVALDAMLELNREALAKLTHDAPSCLTAEMPIADITGMMKVLNVDLGKYWVIQDEFLDLLTKTQLDALAVEIGLKKVLPDFSKLMAGKKDAIIKAFMAAKGKFDFAGKIPVVMKW